MEHKIKGRFAPSPSGYMHMGNLLTMLLAWMDVRTLGGRMVFRLEDLDPVRSKTAYAQALTDDLRWLGLDWDEGWPEDSSYAQSQRIALYEDVFHTLQKEGLVYPCFCTRAQRLAAASAPHAGEAIADAGCSCAHMTAAQRREMEDTGRRPAWKLHAPDLTVTVEDRHYGFYSQNLAREGGDCIIRRSDGVYAYQLTVAVDDCVMGVTRVVRGRDLLSSAPRQAWLIEKLGGTVPEYCHAPLLTKGGSKLSKRLGCLSTQTLRQEFSPAALTGRLAFLCGLIPEEVPITPGELLPLFSWEKIKRENIQI